jgi:hypothetical protein
LTFRSPRNASPAEMLLDTLQKMFIGTEKCRRGGY